MNDQDTFIIGALNSYIVKKVNLLQEGNITEGKKISIVTLQEVSEEIERLQELAADSEEDNEAPFEYQEAEEGSVD